MAVHNLLCLIGFTLASLTSAEETLRITNGEWPPYLGEQLPGHGIASRIVSEAFANQGIKTHYEFFPWNRSFVLAQSGNWDGSAIWLHSPEREKDFYLSAPVIHSTYVFFHLKATSFQWKTLDDLTKMTIGATRGYDYGEAFKKAEAEKKITVYREASDEQNLRLLLLKRIQIFPVDREVGLMMLKQHFTPEEAARITMHPLPLRSDPLHLLLTRRNPDNQRRMMLFNQGLKKLHDSGRIKTIQGEGGAKPH